MMSTGIKNKATGYHNRRSIRFPGYDYSRPGYYFVTICIWDRKQNLFGDIDKGAMTLDKFGVFAEQCWREIPEHFPHIILDEFIIMPNHVHGIIKICNGSVGTNNYSSLRPQPTIKTVDFPHRPQGTSKTIGSIIRGFKIGVTNLVRQQIPGKAVWQRNCYEHIIRDGKSLFFIRKYIREIRIIGVMILKIILIARLLSFIRQKPLARNEQRSPDQ